MLLDLRRFALALVLTALLAPLGARADAGDDAYSAAAKLYAAQRWPEACEAFARMLADTPDHPRALDARFFYGEALAQARRYGEAHSQFAELLKRDPDHRLARQALFRGGESAYLAGDAAAAKTELESFHDHHPADALNAYALPYLADLELEGGNAAAAQKQFTAALAQFADGPLADECRLGLAQCHEQLGQWDEARREYQALIEAGGLLVDQALVHLGAVENARGDFPAALADYDRLARDFPNSKVRAKAESGRGYALFKLERYPEAAEALALARANDMADKCQDAKSRAATEETLAICYARLGRFLEAQKIVAADDTATGDGSRRSQARYQIAEAAYAAGELKVAEELFATLAVGDAASATTAPALTGLGWCQFKAGRWGDAEKTLGRLIADFSDSPSVPEAALLRGRALEHLNESAAALVAYQVILDRYADDAHAPEAIWSAARLQEQGHDMARALELYQRLADEHPDFAECDAALYRAALLTAETDPQRSGALLNRLRHDFPHSRFAADAALRMAERALEDQNYDDAERMLADVLPPEAAADTAETPADAKSRVQRALYLQGRLAMARGKFSAVETPLASLIDRFPDSEWVLPAEYLMAEARYRQGDFAQAAERLAELATKSSGNEPWCATAELRRAQALAQLKRWDESLAVARSIEPRFPNFDAQMEVDYLIGRCLVAGADFDGAREAYAKVLVSPQAGKTQTAAMARWMIGESYFHQENYAAALAQYAQVDERYPFPRWQAAALLQSAKCHEFLDQWREAVETYQRIATMFPTSSLNGEASERLAAAQRHLAAASGQARSK